MLAKQEPKIWSIAVVNKGGSQQTLIDMKHRSGIIIMMIGMPISGDRGAHEQRQPAAKGPCPPRGGHIELSPRELAGVLSQEKRHSGKQNRQAKSVSPDNRVDIAARDPKSNRSVKARDHSSCGY